MRTISLFPLQTVLFPGMPLPLQIFEKRYKEMILRCLEERTPFGVVYSRQPIYKGQLSQLGMQPIGCLAKIVQSDLQPDGQIQLLTIGADRFRVQEIIQFTPYLVGIVTPLPIDTRETLHVVRNIPDLKPWIPTYIDLLTALRPEISVSHQNLTPEDYPENPETLLYLAAALLQIPLEEKQRLLEISSSPQLLNHLQRLYRREVSLLKCLHKISASDANRAAWLN